MRLKGEMVMTLLDIDTPLKCGECKLFNLCEGNNDFRLWYLKHDISEERYTGCPIKDSTLTYGKWISVKDELPEEETDVLVCCETGAITVCCGSYSTEVSDTFIWYTGGWRFGKVVAWMPLPEPYKVTQ